MARREDDRREAVRSALGVLLAGFGGVALAGGVVWSNIDGWGPAAWILVGSGVAGLLAALLLLRRAFLFTARDAAGMNAVLSVVLALTAFGLLSYINQATNRWEIDLTRARKFSLSKSTRSLLAGLTRDVEVTVVRSPEASAEDRLELDEDIMDLVDQYEHHSGGRLDGRIWGLVEDQARFLSYLRELDLEVSDLSCPLVIVRCGQAHRRLDAGDFVVELDREHLAFRGEEALTNAILEVTEGEKRKVYFASGHGEGETDLHTPRGFTRLRAAIHMDNLEVALVNLEQERSVPADCAVLVLLGPRRAFTDPETAAVEAYLEKGGRVFVLFASPIWTREGTPRLERLLERWGVRMLSGVVFDRESNYQGDPSWVWVSRYGGHAIVSPLEGSPSIYLLPRGMSLLPDVAAPGGGRLVVDPLVTSSGDSWCESNLNPAGSPTKPGPGDDDVKGPIVIGCVVREVPPREGAGPGARLVVLGHASFLSNRNLDRFEFAAHAHLGLFRNAVNWLLDREALIRIPPRKYEGFRRLSQLDITDRSIRLVMWAGMIGMPLAVLLLGVAVWFIRRR